VNGTTEGNAIWQSEGVVRRFKTANIYIIWNIYINIEVYQQRNFFFASKMALLVTLRDESKLRVSEKRF
jgi:hypothetical protein